MLASLTDYSAFVYTLQDQYPFIQRSTLVLIPAGATLGTLQGELEFRRGIRLSVLERLDFGQERIEYYSYAVYQDGEKLYWYDPQPHPDDPALASTHPHHKHIPPDIKHHRVPAPELSFEHANLPFLLQEIEQTLLTPDVD